jgi:hypothetical protein
MKPNWRRFVWQHGWKLFLIPLFVSVPVPVRVACAAIVLTSLIVDVVLYRRERARE